MGGTRRRVAGAALFGALVFLFSGCVSAPVQEMSNARQAVVAATDAGAERHAAGVLAQARAYLRSAEANLKRHDYREARRDAVVAREKAVAELKAAQAARDLPTSGP